MAERAAADSVRSGAQSDDVAVGPGGAGRGGAASGAAPARLANSGNPVEASGRTRRGQLSPAAAAVAARPAAAPLSAQQFPPWRRTLGQGRSEVFLYVARLKRHRRGANIARQDLADRREKVCSFLRHLERGVAPTPALTQYENRVDHALKCLMSADNRAFVPAEIADWAAAIYDKFERENWGRPSDNNNNGTTAANSAANASQAPAAPASAAPNAAPAPAPAQAQVPVPAPAQVSAPAPAPAPAPAAAPAAAPAPAPAPAQGANQPLPLPADFPHRVPHPNHAIWGRNGIMHGLYIKPAILNRRGRAYDFDPRYKAYKRDAKVHGHNGLVPGAWWPRQIVALYHGAHGSAYKGIFGNPTDGAYSIVISGQSKTYHDLDRDSGDTVIYSADMPTGGNGDNNVAAAQSADTRALRTSIRTGRPVRVLRSAGKDKEWAPAAGIRYDGLYRVVGEFQADNGKGGTVVKFRLRRMGNQTPLVTIRDSVPSPQQIRDEKRVKHGY